eukprot:scaffold13086_cov41-Prasinocladus_malaysianus.AAC.1
MEAYDQCYDSYFGNSGKRGRRLLASDEDNDSSGGLRDGLNGLKWGQKASEIAKELVEDLLDDGSLPCPPPECFTDDAELLRSYAGISKPNPAIEANSADLTVLASPWYHAIDEGYCAWRCDGEPEASVWCNKGVDNCMKCKGKWCPPSADLPWQPATFDTYVPKPE